MGSGMFLIASKNKAPRAFILANKESIFLNEAFQRKVFGIVEKFRINQLINRPLPVFSERWMLFSEIFFKKKQTHLGYLYLQK